MTLRGFRRPDGRVGFRNHVLILPTVACSNIVAQKISNAVPGTISIANNTGCGLLAGDLALFTRTIINTAGNPNVAATLVVGLGCESISAEQAAAGIKKFGKPVEYLSIQKTGGTLKTLKKGIALARKLVEQVNDIPREPAAISDLVLAVECGGSDPASGLSANVALGSAVDKIIDAGGSAIISETDEFVGAEMITAANTRDKATGKRLLQMVRRFEKHIKMYGADLSNGQPSRGNVLAGLTTIEEKSLGCARKIGTRPLVQVVEFGEIPTKKGPVFMDSPGFDLTSVSGLVASGCQVMVFTTGLGTPLGNGIIPVIKIISNTPGYRKMKDDLDMNAGTILEGTETIEQVGDRIYTKILRVCSGQKTKTEILGENQFCVWQTQAQL
jgi:altronate dehydratase large subunit